MPPSKVRGKIMPHNQPSDSTSSVQAGIEKLISLSHSAAYLSCQIQEVTAILTGTMQGNPDPATVADDLGSASSKLSSFELMELINLENTRQALMRSWRFVESRKAGIIEQARERSAGEVKGE
jgi:hypothetical protein